MLPPQGRLKEGDQDEISKGALAGVYCWGGMGCRGACKTQTFGLLNRYIALKDW